MTDGDPKRSVTGYVSAYLTQPLRTLAEAEKDCGVRETGGEASGPRQSPDMNRSATKTPQA